MINFIYVSDKKKTNRNKMLKIINTVVKLDV